jgi:hypothetical protein
MDAIRPILLASLRQAFSTASTIAVYVLKPAGFVDENKRVGAEI